jgi:predicted acyltransferase
MAVQEHGGSDSARVEIVGWWWQVVRVTCLVGDRERACLEKAKWDGLAVADAVFFALYHCMGKRGSLFPLSVSHVSYIRSLPASACH